MTALCTATLGVAASPCAARTLTAEFEPGTDSVFAFPAPPDGYAYDHVDVRAKGADGGAGAHGGTAGIGGLAATTLTVGPGSRVRVIVGFGGFEGDPEEQASAPGGEPGGGAGVQGGGGGGGYSAVCNDSFDSEGDAAIALNCFVVAGGGGGGGGQPPSLNTSFSGHGGPGLLGGFGQDGAAEATAGPGRGGGGEQAGAGGDAGAGAGARPGARGLPGQDHDGGVGGTGGTTGGGGGGGGGGAAGGQGGGGGGSCGADQQDECPDGFAGGGGGEGGSTITRGGDGAVNGEAYVEMRIVQKRVEPAPTATASPAPTGPPAATAGAATGADNGTGVTVPIACGGAPGGTCALTATLTAILPGGRKARIAKRRRSVRVGLAAVTLTTGQMQTVAVPLTRAGRRLLSKRKRLKVRLKVTQRGAGTVGSAKLTLRKR